MYTNVTVGVAGVSPSERRNEGTRVRFSLDRRTQLSTAKGLPSDRLFDPGWKNNLVGGEPGHPDLGQVESNGLPAPLGSGIAEFGLTPPVGRTSLPLERVDLRL
jgi:hypothetical protein